jgi:hypothetical protein
MTLQGLQQGFSNAVQSFGQTVSQYIPESVSSSVSLPQLPTSCSKDFSFVPCVKSLVTENPRTAAVAAIAVTVLTALAAYKCMSSSAQPLAEKTKQA